MPRFTECEALLFGGYDRGKKTKPPQKGEPCLATATFTSRGKPCCWVHYQADTVGPRAGELKWYERAKKA